MGALKRRRKFNARGPWGKRFFVLYVEIVEMG